MLSRKTLQYLAQELMMNCFWAWQAHKFNINPAVLLSGFFQHFFSGLILESSGKIENQLLHIFSFSCASVMILCFILCAVIHLFYYISATGYENPKFSLLFIVMLQKCHGLLYTVCSLNKFLLETNTQNTVTLYIHGSGFRKLQMNVTTQPQLWYIFVL